MPTLINNPKHWRDRADEARAIADMMSDTVARSTMFEIAAGYDRLAERAEQRKVLSEAVVPESRNLP
jgi:hypothetical protein